MKVVILCGGFGTRIRDVSENLPKPMIPIGRYPILWHIMKFFSTYGYNEFVLCLGYKGRVIKDFFLNYNSSVGDFTLTLGSSQSLEYHNPLEEANWKITFAETGLESMTGSRLSQISKYVGKEDFFFTYGDGVSNVDISKLLEFHLSHSKCLTVTGVRPPGRFGELMHNNYLVSEFNEKPQATAGLISGGFFVARSNLFDYLEDSPDLVFEQEPIRNIVKDRQLMLYEHSGFWQPMDTLREYKLLNSLYSNKSAPWVRW